MTMRLLRWFGQKQKSCAILVTLFRQTTLKPLINLARIVALENLAVEMTTGKIYHRAHVYELAT